jgi:hypothetical protein
MRLLREWTSRLIGTRLRRRRDEDLDAELRAQVELAVEEARRRGETPERAARVTRLRVGGVSQSMESMRDRRGLPWLEDLFP